MSNNKKLEAAVRAYCGGNDEAFAAIYNESKAYVRKCICNALGSEGCNEDMIADVMQDTYFDISKALVKLERTESFLAFAATVARRKSMKALHKNNKYVLALDGEDVFDVADDNELPEDIILDVEKHELVRSVINNELTGKEKACIVGYYYNDMKQNEVAQKLGMSENTVKTNIRRAKGKLAKALTIAFAVAIIVIITVALLTITMRKDETPAESSTEESTQTDSTKENDASNYEINMDAFTLKDVVTDKYKITFSESNRGKSYSIVKYDENGRNIGGECYDEDGVLTDMSVRRYDKNNNCIFEAMMLSGGIVSGYKCEYECDKFGNIVKKVVINGKQEKEVVKYELTYDGERLKKKSYKEKGIEYEIEYDTEGRELVSMEKGAYINSIKRYEYNSEGKLVKIMEYRINSEGKEEFVGSYVYEYDKEGRLIKVTIQNDYGAYADEYTYNGRFTYCVRKVESGAISSVKGLCDDYSYDLSGMKSVSVLKNAFKGTKMKDVESEITRKVKKSVRQYSPGEGNDNSTYGIMNYDENGNVVRVDNYTNNDKLVGYVMKENEYDSTGKVTRKVMALYDSEGNRMCELDSWSMMEYDDAGRITSSVEQGMVKFEYLYDSQGRLTEEVIIDENGKKSSAVKYSYRGAYTDVIINDEVQYTSYFNEERNALENIFYNNRLEFKIVHYYDDKGRVVQIGKEGPSSGNGVIYTYEEIR